MSCFGVVAAETSAIGGGGRGGSRRPWRWWRAKCAGIAAAVGSRIRKSIRKGIDGRRRHHHRRSQSFAPVYADELYSHHHHPPKPLLRVVLHDHDAPAPTTTSGDAKPPAVALPPPVVAHAAAPVARAAARATVIGKGAADASRGGVPARAGGAAVAAAGVGAAMRNVLLRSPGRGGGGVLGAVKGMGEVDLRAELFIRKFKEDMRLQGQRSAEEFQAMLARGL